MGKARPDPVLDYFAANLRNARKRRGLTQKDLAERMKVDVRYLQRIERASVNVGLMTLARFAAVLDVRCAELLRQAKLPKAKAGRPSTKKAKPARTKKRTSR
jgi:transcriptional regulator with XRE-family HTH domain